MPERAGQTGGRPPDAPPPLERAFFARPTTVVARALLGCTLVRRLPDGALLTGRIVETEAYLGVRDRACHTFGGRRTPRNATMWGPAGHLYVYFTYGMHWCCNIVSGSAAAARPAGGLVGQAVLLRALEPRAGHEAMRARRAPAPGRTVRDEHLLRGPACLTRALSIDRALDGADLTTGQEVWVASRPRGARIGRVVTTPRVGVDNRGEATSWPLRFALAGHASVSGPRV
jgi:DNA-3-methyladenine glycosylase